MKTIKGVTFVGNETLKTLQNTEEEPYIAYMLEQSIVHELVSDDAVKYEPLEDGMGYSMEINVVDEDEARLIKYLDEQDIGLAELAAFSKFIVGMAEGLRQTMENRGEEFEGVPGIPDQVVDMARHLGLDEYEVVMPGSDEGIMIRNGKVVKADLVEVGDDDVQETK